MNKTKIKRIPSKKRVVQINIRITKDLSKWLKEKDYSPTGIFMEAVKDLGYKTEANQNESKKKQN